MKRQKHAVTSRGRTCAVGLTASSLFRKPLLFLTSPFAAFRFNCLLISPCPPPMSPFLICPLPAQPPVSPCTPPPRVPLCTHPHEPADWDLLINVAQGLSRSEAR